MLTFCSDVNKVVSSEGREGEGGRAQKQHVVDMLNNHVAKIDSLVNLMKTEAKSEEASAKYNAGTTVAYPNSTPGYCSSQKLDRFPHISFINK